MLKIPEDLKEQLGQLIFWSIVSGIVLVGIIFVDEVMPYIKAFLS